MPSKTEGRNFIQLPPELTQALGEVSARYGQIEYLLTITLRRTAPISYSYADAFDKVEELKNRRSIRKEVKKSFKRWATEEFDASEAENRVEEFNDLIENWVTLADRRDDVIHCCWSLGVEHKELSGTRKGELLTWDGCVVGLEHVQRLADNLRQFVIRLNMATTTNHLSGPENRIASMPPRFSKDYIMPLDCETLATAAATYKLSDYSTDRSDD